MSLGASLSIAWTDPLVIGAVGLGVLLVAGLGIYWRRQGSSSTVDAAATSPPHPTDPRAGAGAGPGPSPGPGAGQGPGAEGAREDPTPDPPEVSPEDLAEGTGRTLAEMAANEEVDDTELISRFVHNMDGEQLGETMTIDEGEVILKRDGDFFSVPPDAIIEKSGTLLADANIDWDEAREAGEAWEDENLDRMEYNEEGLPEA